MSQHQQYFTNQSAGPINQLNISNFNLQQEESEIAQSPKSRRDFTNSIVEKLYKATLIGRPGERDVTRTGGRKNKNEILGLTLARLIKEKHLNGVKFEREIELTRNIQLKSHTNSFVLILRTDGRIVAMSDEVEQHFGKSMRSLYTQCIDIFECLDKEDGEKLRSILDSYSSPLQSEHRLVCTFRLPKGKRPSRIQEDIKTISMVGHFYSCHDASSSSCEKLFIARCEALLSRTKNGSNVFQTSSMVNGNDNSNSMIQITLSEDMSINSVSANTRDVLGYSRNEMVGNWIGRYLTIDGLDKFEIIRKKYFGHEHSQQQNPIIVCDIFDIYTHNGSGLLTFLCQIRPIRERRSKSIKYSVICQLIDPASRNEYNKYIESQSEINSEFIRVDQVNHGLQSSTAIPKTNEKPIMAHSPTIDKGLFKFDDFKHTEFTNNTQYSTFHRSLSKMVSPININDDIWSEFFDNNYDQNAASTEFSNSTIKYFDDYLGCQLEENLTDLLDDFLNEF